MKRNVLKGKIIEKFGSIENFCKNNAINRTTIYRILKDDKYDTSYSILLKINSALQFSEEEIKTIFFAEDSA